MTAGHAEKDNVVDLSVRRALLAAGKRQASAVPVAPVVDPSAWYHQAAMREDSR